MLERKRKIAIRLLITGSGVRVPHNPLISPVHRPSKPQTFLNFLYLIVFPNTSLTPYKIPLTALANLLDAVSDCSLDTCA